MEEGKKIKVYIAGGMSAYPDWNFPAFYATEERFKEAGFDVINPAREFDKLENPSTLSWEECMKHALQHFLEGNAITMLPGWEKSRGAVTETALARNLGYKVYDAETTEELPITILPLTLV